MKLNALISSFLLATFTSVLCAGHPETSGSEWKPLFDEELKNTIRPGGVWSVENGILTASEDKNIWTSRIYDNFILDLEFKTAAGTNSGVIVYCSDVNQWIPNSVEIQIADDYDEKWIKAGPTWQCGAVFGHLAASKKMVKKPGEWNRYTITVVDSNIKVILNGEEVIDMDLWKWTSGTHNPDGTEIPPWLSTPFAELPTFGHIGFQGKHAGAPIYFRNIKVKELK